MAGKTEWEDALIKHGIMEAPPPVVTDDDLQLEAIEAMDDAKELLQEAKLTMLSKKKGLDALDAFEDNKDTPQDMLERIRARRLAELKALAEKSKFGKVQIITKADYKKEVNEAGPDIWVVIHLFAYSKPECKLLDQSLDKVAQKFRAVKFLRIPGSDAIENFPESSCPTVLIYKGGEMIKQLVGAFEWGGSKTSEKSVEWVLSQLKVVETDLDEDPLKTAAKTVKRLDYRTKQQAQEDPDSDFSD